MLESLLKQWGSLIEHEKRKKKRKERVEKLNKIKNVIFNLEK